MSGYTGEILALLSALSFAVANVTIAATSGSRGDKGVLFSVIVTMTFAFALFVLLEADRTILTANRDTMAGLALFAFAGVAAMCFGRSLVFESIRRLGATRASAVKRLNPFFSVLLAALILSEPVTLPDAAGLVALAVAFALLIRDSRASARAGDIAASPVAYGIGAGAALAYAIAYIGRKAGLERLDAPALGTFVSALAGLAAFAVLAVLWPRYRQMFASVFRNIDRWVAAASLFISAGQILMFAALAYTSVATVVMISSLEIFFSIFLTTLAFRTERRPGPAVLLAAFWAVAGVALVAAG